MVLEDGEVERYARLYRKAVQHALAEGVDGLDLEAARRVKRMSEESAGTSLFGTRRNITCYVPYSLTQAFGIEQRPCAEPPGDALAHLGSRRLGVGEAEDLLGRNAGEQQAQHALGQDVGLARAGIGLDPHRGVRVGGGPLRADDGRIQGLLEDAGHSLSSPSFKLHSSVRLKWS